MNYIDMVMELNDMVFKTNKGTDEYDNPIFTFSTSGYSELIEFEGMVVFNSECDSDITYDYENDKDRTQEEVKRVILNKTIRILERLQGRLADIK